jgi:hypothetical protein
MDVMSIAKPVFRGECHKICNFFIILLEKKIIFNYTYRID